MTIAYQDSAVQLLQGDVLAVLKTLPDNYVQTVVTSPPYWSLRDYKVPAQVWGGLPTCKHRWGKTVNNNATNQTDKRRWQHTRNGRDEEQPKEKRVAWLRTKVPQGQFCVICGAWAGSFGLEPTPDLFVQHIVDIFRDVRRVLKDDGTLWLNLGDSYNAAGRNGHGSRQGFKQGTNRASANGHDDHRGTASELKEKDLVGIPWRVAFALQADGWYLRSDIIWSKPNPMPESVRDRPTKSHEYLFLLTKSPKYYYDAEAIKEPAIYADEARYDPGTNGLGGNDRKTGKTTRRFAKPTGWDGNEGAHTKLTGNYPDKQRGHGRRHDGFNDRWDHMTKTEQCSNLRNKRSVWTVGTAPFPDAHFATFPEQLIEPCVLAGAPAGGLVLDPFSGAGTTLLVAKKLNRRGVGIELNPDYCTMSAKRLQIEPARLL